MSERSDDELVFRCKQGDAQSFNELVYRYKNDLYQYILAMVRDEGAAEDIFQEVFLNFYRRMNDYQSEGKFKSYLFTSARNRIMNYFRDQKRLLSLDDTDEEGNAYLHESIIGKDLQPLEHMSQAESLERIKQASLALPEKQREVVYLKQLMTFQEVADMVKRPLGTVLADYHRGIKKMQAILKGANL